jgi:hypothetical protein
MSLTTQVPTRKQSEKSALVRSRGTTKKPTDENKGSQDQKRSAAHGGGKKKKGKKPAERTAVTPP